MTVTFEQIRSAFPDGQMDGKEWRTLCWLHGDTGAKHANLIIGFDNEKLIVHCDAGCDQTTVFHAVLARILKQNPESKTYTQAPPKPWEKSASRDWGYSENRLRQAEAALDRAAEYLANRGISMDTARRLRFGFENGYLVMPYFVDGELAAVKLRASKPVNRDQKWKKHNRDKKTYWLFNRDELKQAVNFADDLYITESELDAAMLISAGYRAVSVDSAQHTLTESDSALLKAFQGQLVFAPDMDKAGIACAMRLVEELGLENAISIKPKTKDLGELYALDSTTFPDRLESLQAHAGPVWQASFRATCELEQGEPRQLIKGVLIEGINLNGSCSGVGKTWLQVSESKALTTGERFVGVFEVPERVKVIYLIPESGDKAFGMRCYKMGIPSDGSVFLCRTLKDGILRLDDPALLMAIRDWHPAIFLDTAVRFAEFKDENSSADNAGGLAESLFSLMREGALAVTGAHHSKKDYASLDKKGKYTHEDSLENCLRGTGDIGAMCDTVWSLRHDDGGKDAPEEYIDASKNLTRLYVSNVKPRDFEPADPFVIQGKPYIDELGDFVVRTSQENSSNRESRGSCG